MHTVYLALGTNLGYRTGNLRAAISALPPSIIVRQSSPIYETPPWGLTDQPAFLNQVILAQTDLSPLELLAFLKGLEAQLGRQPGIRYGPRLIALDILLYNDLQLETPSLAIPTRAWPSGPSSWRRLPIWRRTFALQAPA